MTFLGCPGRTDHPSDPRSVYYTEVIDCERRYEMTSTVLQKLAVSRSD